VLSVVGFSIECMSESVVFGSEAAAALRSVRAGLDQLLGADLTRLCRDELLEVLREVEVQVRRLPVFDHRLVAELEQRGVAAEQVVPSTAAFLAQLLRITPAEAKARVAAAGELGPRLGVTGEPLGPLFPLVAAAQAAGAVSAAQARVITSTIDALPGDVEAQYGDGIQRFLLEHCADLNPNQLATAALRIAAYVNPTDPAENDRQQARRREVTLTPLQDGSGLLRGRLTAAALAVWQTIFDSLAAPAPAADGTRDPRTAGQRRHDALLDAGLRLLRSADLPDCGGAPVTVVATLTEEQLRERAGYATTGHGDPISVAGLLALAAEADVIPVVLNDAGGVMSYGRTRRLASPAQRRALTARDRGCCFPQCTRPAAWTEAHHVIPWSEGGTTDLDNLALLCGHDHREHRKQGWDCVMIGGVPHWRPPAFLDPDRKPRRNTTHHTGDLLAGRYQHLTDQLGPDPLGELRTATTDPLDHDRPPPDTGPLTPPTDTGG
jgi:hypothetical protein